MKALNIIVATLLTGAGVFAQTTPSPSPTPALVDPAFEVVQLHDGVNYVDLNNDGVVDTVVVANRSNFNAHSFQVTTVCVWAAINSQEKLRMQIVPFEPGSDEEKDGNPLALLTGGGADGNTQDYRLLLSRKDRSFLLITAHRAFGQSFADSQPVTFRFYNLAQNTPGIAGLPILYFKRVREVVSKAKYQDVEDAFSKELGLGDDGRPGRQ